MSKTKRIPIDISIKKLIIAQEIVDADLQSRAKRELALHRNGVPSLLR